MRGCPRRKKKTFDAWGGRAKQDPRLAGAVLGGGAQSMAMRQAHPKEPQLE
jgi:hypothetical protein